MLINIVNVIRLTIRQVILIPNFILINIRILIFFCLYVKMSYNYQNKIRKGYRKRGNSEMRLIPDVKYETVRDILQGKAFEGKTLWLPTVQRDFVWNERRIVDFIDSLYKGYPVGVITIIKTKHPFPKAPVEDGKVGDAFEERLYIIDGQQRITSLLLMKNNKKDGKKLELSRSCRG